MSKKDYIKLATAFGATLRHFDGNESLRGSALMIIEDFTRVAKSDNPAFDSYRFMEWINEVSDGRRDMEGKKVKSA